MPPDVARTPTAAGRRRVASRPAPAGPPQEGAQLVWRRALDSADPSAQHDQPALALELLRAAHHDPATMAHALNLGRTHLHAHPEDALARGGVTILDAAIAFLGIKPRAGDIAVARR